MTAAAEQRKRLLRAGFAPLPCQGKRPVLKAWEKKDDTNDGEIELWDRVFPDARNTGFLTRLVPVLDIDVTNPEAAAAIEDLVRERYEADRGVVLVRIGKPPKRCIPFRTDAPFKKISANLIAPNGSTDQKIELLADGQQVVCHGVH